MKRLLILVLLILINTKIYSQDSLIIKEKIDSILLVYSKNSIKKFNRGNKEMGLWYFFGKRSKQLIRIETAQTIANEIWVYTYYFIDGQLSMIRKWNHYPMTNKKVAVANYYFNNNKLITRNEKGTNMEDISLHLSLAEKLKLNSPNY